jgi:ribosomal protein S18 acetylase RimI-like enzyme
MDVDKLQIVKLDEDNLESEHICCGFASKKNEEGYRLKKAWLRARIGEGFTFKKFDVRGKVFIEYVPAEFAWRPIEAPGYLCIQCFWVSGRYQKHGLARRLLQECLDDAQGTHGLVVVTSKRKKPFLTDKRFFVKHGFQVCDEAQPYFELLVHQLDDAPLPRFRETARGGTWPDAPPGAVIFYTDQCPFAHHYVDEMLEAAATLGVEGRKVKLTSTAEVQNGPSPFGISGVYFDGQFVTHELMTGKRFEKVLQPFVTSG